MSGRFAKDGINWVKIVLNGLDLYDIEYGIKRKAEIVIKATSTNIYCDMLQKNFTANTGLYTRLG